MRYSVVALSISFNEPVSSDLFTIFGNLLVDHSILGELSIDFPSGLVIDPFPIPVTF